MRDKHTAANDIYVLRELEAYEVDVKSDGGGGGGDGGDGGGGGDRRKVTSFTSTGVVRSVVVPSPSSPALLSPQHFAVPSVSTAHEWSYPRTTLVAVVMPETSTGVVRSVVVPSPS